MINKKLNDYCFIMSKRLVYPKKIIDDSFGYIILSPINGYHLTRKQWQCIFDVLIEKNQISSVYNLDIEIMNCNELNNLEQTIKNITTFQRNISYNNIENTKVREIDIYDPKHYFSQMLLFENIIMDRHYEWSISVFQDEWGIFFAKKEILKIIQQRYDINEDIKHFKEMVKWSKEQHNIDLDYIDTLINNAFINS